MIQFDFDYYRPQSVQDAVEIMRSYIDSGRTAVYYAGGTELVTNFRKGKAKADAVIDIKGIDLLTKVGLDGDTYQIGAAVSLNRIVEEVDIEAFQTVLKKIADHTTRNALTLGGNICGRLTYKEAVLPLLAMDAQIVIAGSSGIYDKPIREVFDKRLKLKKDELLVQVKLDKRAYNAFSVRETEGIEIDYPILHLFAHREEGALSIALSGYSSLPVFTQVDDEVLKLIDSGELDSAVSHIYKGFEKDARACQRASVDYRRHLLSCALEDMAHALKGGDVNGA